MSPSRFPPQRVQQKAPAPGSPPARAAGPVTTRGAGLRPGRSGQPAGQRPPVPGGQRPTAAGGQRPTAAGGRSLFRSGPAAPPFLALACDLAPGQAGLLAEAVLARSRQSGSAGRTVILDLREAAEVDEAACAALCGLRDKLADAGSALLVVVASRQVRDQISAVAPPHDLDAELVQLTLRSAVLAVYAALPGPGVVTAEMRAALARPPEPLFPEPVTGSADPAERHAGSPAPSASPAEDGAPAGGSCWTECSPGSSAEGMTPWPT